MTTTKTTDLLAALANLVDTHGAVAVITALSDACDASGDSAETTVSRRGYHGSAFDLRRAAARVAAPENRAAGGQDEGFDLCGALEMLSFDDED
jgi:hypothetical protein